jgi:hypothetical protein
MVLAAVFLAYFSLNIGHRGLSWPRSLVITSEDTKLKRAPVEARRYCGHAGGDRLVQVAPVRFGLLRTTVEGVRSG